MTGAAPSLRDLLSLPPREARHILANMHQDEFRIVVGRVLEEQKRQRRENQILYYKPVSPHAEQIHLSKAQTVGVFGGNRSSKSDSCLAELSMCCTGVIPLSLCDKIDPKEKLRGPVSCRVVVESLTTTLHPMILPKLQYWKWQGVDSPGGERGHWGWIPRNHLIGGSWEKSWSEKLRMLRIIYRDPDDPRHVGESTIQFLSIDQDPSDFASGEFHIVLHDEPPNLAIWQENEARTMSVGGRMLLAMTWPDDPAIAVDWIFDKVYEPGHSDDPDVECIVLDTTDNPNIDQDAIAAQARKWTEEIVRVRHRGQHIRFSNRIHPLFTDQTHWWCFVCGKPVIEDAGKCRDCKSGNIVSYNHVEEFEAARWPTVFLIDPHPRKPHMMCWVQISPQDDWWEIAEVEVDGDPVDVRKRCDEIEMEHNLVVAKRLVDPNIARSPSGATRGVTWQDEFARAGLILDLADDSDVGRQRVNDMLVPDEHTLSPRYHIHPRCKTTIRQMKRYRWDDYKRQSERDLKQKPKERDDDYPTLLKYLGNVEPTFRWLREGPRVIHRRR